jgi:hypothetical protein
MDIFYAYKAKYKYKYLLTQHLCTKVGFIVLFIRTRIGFKHVFKLKIQIITFYTKIVTVYVLII